MSTLLHCSICKELFKTQSTLKNHIKHVHQSTVKIKLANGKVREITRSVDNGFECECGNVFQYPQSLFRHAKRCYSTTVDPHIELPDGISFSMDSTTDNILSEPKDLGDCIGTGLI